MQSMVPFVRLMLQEPVATERVVFLFYPLVTIFSGAFTLFIDHLSIFNISMCSVEAGLN